MRSFRPIVLFASALLCAAVPLRAQSNVGESAVFAFDTRDYTTGLAAESATFAFDTRVVDGLSGSDLSGTFVLDTSFASAPPLNVIGTVRDTSGVALGGVGIALKRYETVFWQGTSSGGGTFSASNLSPWTYAVVATKTGYVTSITALPANAGGSLPFQVTMTPLPPAPTAIDVVRTPAQTATRAGPNTSDPAYPVLERFDGSQLVYDLTGLDPSRMTVVIAHGWVPTIGGDYATALDWAKTLAYLIYNHHPGLAQPPNILVWDWRHKANTLSPQVDDAAEEGLELGKALQQALGANYSQHVHFIGHSLGTIVNRYACDYVHGSLAYNNPPTKWLAVQTQPHFTLLDEAEIATVVGQQVITNAVQGYKVAQLQGAVLAATVTAVSDWKYPIPKDAVWVDNYISAFGIQHSAAVNICLPAEALASGNPITAHSYAHLWYRNSVSLSASPLTVGYGLSRESLSAFPPSGNGLTAGSLWYENLNTSDPMDLTLATDPTSFEANLGIWSVFAIVGAQNTGDAILQGYDASIRWAGDVGGTAIVKTGQAITQTTQKVGLWWDAALDGIGDALDSIIPENLPGNTLSAAVFGVELSKSGSVGAQQPSQVADGSGQLRQTSQTLPAATQPAYAWVTLQVPADAGLMAFDFMVTGDPSNDRIDCAINDQNIFSLPANLAASGQTMSTDMMDVSAYAGQTVELFFGLSGGTSTDCTVAIDGIRFITMPTPKIGVTVTGLNVAVKWPAAASGWLLESSETLAAGSWQTVPLGSGPISQSGVLSIQEAVTGPKKFYRLRRTP